MSKLKFDPANDITPIIRMSQGALMLVFIKSEIAQWRTVAIGAGVKAE